MQNNKCMKQGHNFQTERSSKLEQRMVTVHAIERQCPQFESGCLPLYFYFFCKRSPQNIFKNKKSCSKLLHKWIIKCTIACLSALILYSACTSHATLYATILVVLCTLPDAVSRQLKHTGTFT